MFELGESSKEEHQKIVDILGNLNLTKAFLVGNNFFKTRSKLKNICVFESFEDLKKELSIHKIENSTILIKGSRGIAMERILELLD